MWAAAPVRRVSLSDGREKTLSISTSVGWQLLRGFYVSFKLSCCSCMTSLRCIRNERDVQIAIRMQTSPPWCFLTGANETQSYRRTEQIAIIVQSASRFNEMCAFSDTRRVQWTASFIISRCFKGLSTPFVCYKYLKHYTKKRCRVLCRRNNTIKRELHAAS